MDPSYGSIFQNLYSAQSETGYLGQFRAAVAPDPQSTRDTESIRRLIDEAEADLTRSTTQTLRSDARYFLLLNLLQMVFIPFQLHDWSTIHQGSSSRPRPFFHRRNLCRPPLRRARRF